MDQIAFGTNSFAENPEPRVPCILLLDVSSSMEGQPIQELNAGLTKFKDELSGDSMASKRVEVAIVTFGATVDAVCDFTTAEGFFPPHLSTSGMTPMGQAVSLAMEMLERRKGMYRENGISYYRPWIFLITDGAPNDTGWELAAQRAREAATAKAFALFAVGTEGADFNVLRMFTDREPLQLKGTRFRDLFLWLSSSLRSVSQSNPGDEVKLENPATPSGWASVV